MAKKRVPNLFESQWALALPPPSIVLALLVAFFHLLRKLAPHELTLASALVHS